MNRRSAIALTPAEQKEYVAGAQTLTLCTHGPHGYPHAVAMWFAVDDDGTVWMTTYRKSQKAVNIRRDPKVALLLSIGLAESDPALVDQMTRLLTSVVMESIANSESWPVAGVTRRVPQ